MRRSRLERIIEQMVLRIVERFDPGQIIPFCSVVRGNARPDSDLDLLVVMQVEGSRREKAVEIGVAVNDIPMPKDIVVTTPEDFEYKRRSWVRSSVRLYARGDSFMPDVERIVSVVRDAVKGVSFMDGRNRSDVARGADVSVVLKKDLPTGKQTRGIVEDLLTKSPFHPHGIKVRLQGGKVGRVQVIHSAGHSSRV